ncbi:phage minor head protein [Arsenophonus sp. PmNCSU2021_1]|uniref:phage minor head protein n=1 Tax=Arsenophonus sp. PmNCSU2021_1 TaxID=3118989 RepID=UPI002FF413E6
MPQPIDLGVVARLPPKEAIAYFRAKGYHITWNWFEQQADVHARIFTVAKAARLDVLSAIRDEVDRAKSQGISRQDFIDTLTPRLQTLGWWGKQVVVDSQGKAEVVQLGSARRLATIYNVNTRVAYNAGRYAQMMATADLYPYWQYVAVGDSRTRPSHAALHGKVFRYDHPFWQSHYPPNGFNCRCRVRALSKRRLDALGLHVTEEAGQLHTHEAAAGVDKRSGEIVTSPVTTFDDGKVKMTPDVGWSYHPGAAAFGVDQTMIRKLLEVKDAALREAVVQDLNNSPVRQLSFSLWATRIMQSRRAGNGIHTLGFLPEAIARAVQARTGQAPARLLAMSEKNLLHADSDKHPKTGVALLPEDVAALPGLLAKPQAVLWDKAHQNLLFLVPGKAGLARIVVNASYGVKKHPDTLDVVINAYRILNLNKVKSDLAGGKLELLAGTLD